MSRQLDLKAELRETARRDELIKALEFGLVGSLQTQGIELVGWAMKYNPFNCLMTVRADVDGVRSIAFVGSDTMMNCILKAYATASNDALKWRKDKYYSSED